jgi:hypothetical protein
MAVSMSLVLASVLPSSAQDTAARADKIGSVRFPTSCSAAAQGQFEQAVTLLHSFWYEEALKAFTTVTVTDPACAMGCWGIAMSVYYPLWQPPSPAMLEKGWAAIEKTRGLKTTPREQDYIGAIEIYYKDSAKLEHRVRAVAYEKAMEQVYVRYPEDREAAVFYALALNATAAPTDKTYANQLKAGAILEKVYAEQPNHPGVAHYIIHSYDFPTLATRASPPPRGYAKIAPAVPTRSTCPPTSSRGWGCGRSRVNRASAAAGKAYYARLGKDTVWDQTLHALDYVVYSTCS